MNRRIRYVVVPVSATKSLCGDCSFDQDDQDVGASRVCFAFDKPLATRGGRTLRCIECLSSEIPEVIARLFKQRCATCKSFDNEHDVCRTLGVTMRAENGCWRWEATNDKPTEQKLCPACLNEADGVIDPDTGAPCSRCSGKGHVP